MRLLPISKCELTVGRLVVLLDESIGRRPVGMHFIERTSAVSVALEPASFMLENESSEEISIEASLLRLCLLELEEGDEVVFRGEAATIIKSSPNDLHVYVRTIEPPQKELYINMINLDLQYALLHAEVV